MIRIDDPNLMQKLRAVEGAAYDGFDGKKPMCDVSVENAVATWKASIEAGYADASDESAATIYGAGGWNRYFVRLSTGSVCFSEYHGKHKAQLAAEVGFEIWR